MLIKALALLVLVPLCIKSDRVRIISNQPLNQEEDPLANHAYKSRIRSLTLKSSIEQAIAAAIVNGLPNHKAHRPRVHKTNFIVQGSTSTHHFNNGTTTPGRYEDGSNITTITPPGILTSTTPIQPIKTTSLPGPHSTLPPGDPIGCFCIYPCQGCKPTERYPVSPPAVPTSTTQNPPTTTPQCPNTTTPAPGPGPCNQTTPPPPVPGSGCCVIPIAIPCYYCPCLSQCSVVPVPDCPCSVDPSIEYQCPYSQPYGASLNELPEKINNGYRLVENLRSPPGCVYNQGGYPGQQQPYPGQQQSYPAQQPYQVSVGNGFIAQQPNEAQLSVNLKTDEQQPNHFVPLNARAEELTQPQSSNYYLYRQQRQRPFPRQNYPGQNYPGQYNPGQYIIPGQYPVPPGPHPQPPQHPYPVPPHNGSYPIHPVPPSPQGGYPVPPVPQGGYPVWPQNGSYPVGPPQPVKPGYATPPTTTTTDSSSSAFAISSSIVFCIVAVMLSIFNLIN